MEFNLLWYAIHMIRGMGAPSFFRRGGGGGRIGHGGAI